ncbi:DHA1 family bicyclomycin/chloramphenicol resistance-like MFS transporter [Saccharothrix tamanrassetensis]|uniref:DHA1 family bicyclomycin/chloramphenicol resistance-like MFS transporter n=1 Tax=Saccharothrix tamanrassetensis TaxID=1051531 RepID=A0A841CRQ7_9PSEU|nr:multidrug effflux MFS transporter [Saccharothrix tamanrassetensis]MBB5958655.1 DHA1 family bicyclomycin/chloramphenicol resistance-like MFS transporter [Saccharothrix tamanrassetensis]
MSLRRVAVVLGLLETFGPISMDLYLPTLPRLAADLGTSESLAQATMSACMLGLALGQLVVGPLSDRFGRRRPLLVGVGLFALLSLLCAVTPSIELLLAARFFQGLCGSAGIVIALAVARDLTDGVELVRLLAMLTTVGALAPIVAPVVGGQLALVMDWRGIFAVLAGIGVALFVLAATSLPESLPPGSRHARGSAYNFGAVLRDRLFLCFLLVGACGGAAFFTYLASISFVLQDSFSLSPQLFSICFAANAVMSVVGAQVNRVAVRRAGPARMYAIGTTTTAVAAIAMLVAVLLDAGLVAMLVPLALVMLAIGCSQANGSALALAGHRERAGTAAALLGTASFAVGPLVAPLVSLSGTSPLTMSLTMAVAYVGAAVLVWLAVIPRLRRRPVHADQAEVVPPGPL